MGHMPDFSASKIALMHRTRSASTLLVTDTLFNEFEDGKGSQLKALVAVPSRLFICIII